MCRHLTCISSPGVMFTKPAAATWTISPPPSPFFSSAMSQTRTQPIHVAITRRIKPGCEAKFQKALTEFFKTSFAHTGVQGDRLLLHRPDPNESKIETSAPLPMLARENQFRVRRVFFP